MRSCVPHYISLYTCRYYDLWPQRVVPRAVKYNATLKECRCLFCLIGESAGHECRISWELSGVWLNSFKNKISLYHIFLFIFLPQLHKLITELKRLADTLKQLGFIVTGQKEWKGDVWPKSEWIVILWKRAYWSIIVSPSSHEVL